MNPPEPARETPTGETPESVNPPEPAEPTPTVATPERVNPPEAVAMATDD